MTILPATTDEHIENIAHLAHEIWYEYYVPLIGREQVDYMVPRFQSVAAIGRQIRDEGYEYFRVLEGTAADRLVGYFAVQSQEAESKLFLSKFYLHAGARGAGTGRRCMEFIEHLGRRRRLSTLWLTVNKGNPAVAAYQKLGFRVVAAILVDIGSGFVMDDYRMEKSLV